MNWVEVAIIIGWFIQVVYHRKEITSLGHRVRDLEIQVENDQKYWEWVSHLSAPNAGGAAPEQSWPWPGRPHGYESPSPEYRDRQRRRGW